MTVFDQISDAAERWGLDRESPFSGMVLDFVLRRIAELGAGHHVPESLEGWRGHAAEVERRLRRSLGLGVIPATSALNATTRGEIEGRGYRIEKVTYETLPGFIATAHVYVPKSTQAPWPAVLYSPGHWYENCKLEPDIQIFCANLARRGILTLVYDPIGQGERMGDWFDHGHLEPLLVGLSQVGLMVWESMRAVDYLVSRADVDASRIGMTGASGGGLNTLYTSAVETRIHVSVPVCYVTEYYLSVKAERERNWEDGVDLCNQVPEVTAYAEMTDVLGLFAPKPLCVVSGTNDWMFPIDGARRVSENAASIYRMFGAGDMFRLAEVVDVHGYSQPMREAAYGWLVKWLNGEGDGGPIAEEPCEFLEQPYPTALTYIAPPETGDLETLRRRAEFPRPCAGLCNESGKTPRPGPAITRLTSTIADSLAGGLRVPATPEDSAAWREALLGKVRNLLGPFPVRDLVNDRLQNLTVQKEIFAERVVFESEPGILVPSIFMCPTDWERYFPVVVYVDEWGKSEGLKNGIVGALLKAGMAVFAIDVRGVGETVCSDFEAATNALMTDRPLFGQRVLDVVRAVDCLWRRIYASVQIDKGRIVCVGRGAGALLALYAGALDERIAATVLWESPLSYRSLILGQSDFPPSVYLFDVLRHLDLPDLMVAAAPRPLLIADPVDGLRRRVGIDEAEVLCRAPRRAFSVLESRSRAFHVMAKGTSPTDPGAIASWLEECLNTPPAC